MSAMLCESCHQQPATVHLTTIIAGEKTEQHLCAECCQKHKQALTMAGMNTLLATLLQGGADAPKKKSENSLCPVCHTTYHQFSRSGLLGCAKCYSTFQEHLKPMLERVHGRVQHVGRVPRHTEEVNHMQERLDALRRDMDRAVAEEDFERAAQLRDEIRAMQPAREGGVL
jgi:protein arginine kinase activator